MPVKDNTFPTPTERAAALKARRQLKMARSAHAYVRGNTKNFYDWLEGSTGQTVPTGPSIWICGDCHAGNIGPIASAKGTVSIQIRDLDQTIVGNPAHDLIRLGLSMASAARGSPALKVRPAHCGLPSREKREAGEGALPRSAPCSTSLLLQRAPPMT